ncbi:hypothetical protein JCM10450v2_000042 [Rhodotorula kratochvilovae]
MVIRRVLLDAFGTVFSPREPVFQQYTKVARSFGLAVEEGRVKDGFKRSFKEWAKAHPLYGKHSTPPLDATQWWSGVIADTFRHAGVSSSELDPVRARLCDTLIQRFWGAEGYALHGDALPLLRALHALRLPPPAIVSNTDPSVSRILRALGMLEGQTDPPEAGIREREVWTTWEIEEEKRGESFWEEVLRRLRKTASEQGEAELRAEEVLVVGDELASDYEAPRRAGLRSLLLRRDSPTGEHARASYDDEQDGLAEVETVGSLEEVAEWVRRENRA